MAVPKMLPDSVYVRLDPAYSLPDRVTVHYGILCASNKVVSTNEAHEFVIEDADVASVMCVGIEIPSVTLSQQGGQVRIVEVQLLAGP